MSKRTILTVLASLLLGLSAANGAAINDVELTGYENSAQVGPLVKLTNTGQHTIEANIEKSWHSPGSFEIKYHYSKVTVGPGETVLVGYTRSFLNSYFHRIVTAEYVK